MENQRQWQLKGNYLLIPKTCGANVVHQEQDRPKEAQNPASTISPATTLPPASTLSVANVEQ